MFSYSNEFSYSEKLYSDDRYSVLGSFLTSEIGISCKTYKEWVLDPDQTYTYGNFIFLEKNSGTITLFYDPDMGKTEQKRDDWELKNDPYALSIPQESFIHIIECWTIYTKKKFNEIWIKNEGDQYWVEGIR